MAEIGLSARSAQPSNARPATQPEPDLKDLWPGAVFKYHASSDGIDSNLLILFHGLGDSEKPFSRLAASLKLPQTATLSIRSPFQIPMLEEEAFQWWDSFDLLTGDPITNPNPSSSLAPMLKVLDRLVAPQLDWSPGKLHLFGFAQGGSLASELALAWSRAHPEPLQALGSLVSVSGPLLSLPTVAASARSQTPALVFLRQGEDRGLGRATGGQTSAAFRKGFTFVETVTPDVRVMSKTEGEKMLQGTAEWKPIMEFWAKHLIRRNPWEIAGKDSTSGGDMYEVIH